MTGVKFLTLILLSVNVVQLATAACSQSQVNTCLTRGNMNIDTEYRVKLPIPYIAEANLNTFCTVFSEFTTCLDDCRSNTSVAIRFSYEPTEETGKYICDDKQAYKDLSDLINNDGRQTKWNKCFADNMIKTLDGSEDEDVVCPKLRNFTTCSVDVAKEGDEDSEDYMRNWGLKLLKTYDDHYDCDPYDCAFGCYSAAGIIEMNLWLCILALLFFLIQRII